LNKEAKLLAHPTDDFLLQTNDEDTLDLHCKFDLLTLQVMLAQRLHLTPAHNTKLTLYVYLDGQMAFKRKGIERA
jgi:hypothetical protein